jgi:hypothetical protein
MAAALYYCQNELNLLYISKYLSKMPVAFKLLDILLDILYLPNAKRVSASLNK